VVHIPSLMNPAHTLPPDSFKIHFSIILPPTWSGLFPSRFRTKLCTYLSSPIRATYPVHLILLDLISLIITGKEYRLRLSWFLQPCVISCAFGPNALLSPLFLGILTSTNCKIILYYFPRRTLLHGVGWLVICLIHVFGFRPKRYEVTEA
jgi:hypothetical protein